MNTDIQRANMWKRISAAFLDLILLVILITGLVLLLSYVFDYNHYAATQNAIASHYQEAYGVQFDINQDQYDLLSPEQQAVYRQASDAILADPEFNYAANMVINLALTITGLSFFTAFLILEFFVPLALGHGQTIGKKIFGLGLMRTDGVKLTPFALFVRSMLGKCTIESLLPAMMFLSMFFSLIGSFAPTVIFGILAIQIGLLISSKNRACLHDLMGVTVVIDLPSQMIFDTVDDLNDYKKKCAAEEAQKQEY